MPFTRQTRHPLVGQHRQVLRNLVDGAIADQFGRQVAHARILALPACGHAPQRDQPQAVIEATRMLMQAHGADAAAARTTASANRSPR